MSQSFSGNKGSVIISNSFNTTAPDARPEILAWLSPLEPQIRHQDVRNRRISHVGDWLLQTEQFRSWGGDNLQDKAKNATLFCYGDPGAGKTFISSLLIDKLCDQARGRNVSVACFYFDHAARKEQTPTRVLGALLKQVVGGLESIPEEIVTAFEDQKKVIGGRGLELSEIVAKLQDITCSRLTFLCVDALDECPVEYRVQILDSLQQILQKSPATRLFLTGRPQVGREVERYFGGRVQVVPIKPSREDVIGYIRARLSMDPNPDAMDSGLEEEILKSIPEKISEIFLLVSLNVEAILGEITVYGRRKKLKAMTNGSGLGDAYGAMLDRIKAQGGEKARLGMAVLMWICHVERPLRADELCDALGVEIGSPDLNPDNVPSIAILLSCCQGLFTVENETSTVRLIHLTLQEYLSTRSDLFGRAHTVITETCLTYLNSHQVKSLSGNTSRVISVITQGRPFLQYASLSWGAHAKAELSDSAKLLALKLFDDYDNHVSIKLLVYGLSDHFPHITFNRREFSPFNGLHYSSFFGTVQIATALMERKTYEINQRDFSGFTPLTWAARNGQEEMVKLLLRCEDVNPDEPDKCGRTPLSYAAQKGHEGIATLLLRRQDVNPDSLSDFNRTPLSCAAQEGHEGIVALLLRQDANPDTIDIFYRTPLSYAAQWKREGIVALLLGRQDVNPAIVDWGGRRPLDRAIASGYEPVIKLLRAHKALNPRASHSHEGDQPPYQL
ncbi:ankyrin [Choiromyces venosus 120613-1]|uniref:Ankyrin n=1 Tax=Choiromyces venosus 120613-1 TaxID=1336337 RepID=A0A3N4IYU1_9PEZI|nr:ankyrin [Choiromyces venosus 120613-1]